jgi:5-methylcytosine-specific restriction endonuclease McrA
VRRVNLLRAHGSPGRHLYQHRGCRCGLCVASETAYRRLRHAANPEFAARRAAYHRRWRKANPSKGAQYRAAHPRVLSAARQEELRAYWRTYNAARREQMREYLRCYRIEHAEEIREKERLYRQTHVDVIKREHTEHRVEYAARESNRRARKAGNGGTYRAADTAAQHERQHGRCYWCGKRLLKYHVDHVIPVALGGSNDPANLVVACPACNQSKNAKHPMDWAGVLC